MILDMRVGGNTQSLRAQSSRYLVALHHFAGVDHPDGDHDD